ncbi:NAD(P)/FAD-dependent oxidoreductase [Ruminococcaceae bacterium OttesenSCG-928-I18]|nr:NAD(P)/FAD-dependent oxidoreductase [Ruminococcaceae bacterium OttesenSCG-928-I18]
MYDVAILGGGICGCSLLYALSRYTLRCVLLEKENDVGVGATKANSAIVHAGYDPMPGTLMAKYNAAGNPRIRELCSELDVLYKQTGSLVLAFDEADRAQIQKLYQKGLANGIPGLEILERSEVLAKEPSLNPDVLCALYAPTAGVVNPWELAQAQAEVALQNGAEVRLSSAVLGIRRENDVFLLETSDDMLKARFVINATGVASDRVTALLEPPSYTIHPNRGQYFLLDTTQGGLVRHVVFQCPTKKGKGVLVAPTVHGNLIVGPDSDPAEAHDLATTTEGLSYVRQKALKSVPDIDFKTSIRNFAGLRARSNLTDFVVRESTENPGFYELGGIKSPGLSSAPAIAEDLVQRMGKAGLPLHEKPDFRAERRILRFTHLSAEAREEAIRRNPAYGTIVCRCETVTEGEILDALRRPLPPRSLDAVKRRCTAGMGRCQGGFCGPRVQAIIARELGLAQEEVPLDRADMYILAGKTKDGCCRKGDAPNE